MRNSCALTKCEGHFARRQLLGGHLFQESNAIILLRDLELFFSEETAFSRDINDIGVCVGRHALKNPLKGVSTPEATC
jgi:hypothetical protein